MTYNIHAPQRYDIFSMNQESLFTNNSCYTTCNSMNNYHEAISATSTVTRSSMPSHHHVDQVDAPFQSYQSPLNQLLGDHFRQHNRPEQLFYVPSQSVNVENYKEMTRSINSIPQTSGRSESRHIPSFSSYKVASSSKDSVQSQSMMNIKFSRTDSPDLASDRHCHRRGKQSIRKLHQREQDKNRTRSLNLAFARLRSCLPEIPRDTKLTKIRTLRYTIDYINRLIELVESTDEQSMTLPAALPVDGGMTKLDDECLDECRRRDSGYASFL